MYTEYAQKALLLIIQYMRKVFMRILCILSLFYVIDFFDTKYTRKATWGILNKRRKHRCLYLLSSLRLLQKYRLRGLWNFSQTKPSLAHFKGQFLEKSFKGHLRGP